MSDREDHLSSLGMWKESIKAFQPAWDKMRRTAGVPDVRIHDLRHSFASFAVMSGGTLPVIGRLLGHDG